MFPAVFGGCQPAAPAVKTGIDVLREDGYGLLKGHRIGLVTNPSGVARDLSSTADLLKSAPGVTLVALFGPEHGVRGDAPAGRTVQNSRDAATGVPVYSLYGGTRAPTAEMMRGIDMLVFDIQDIGSRSYTFIYTMGQCMAAAARGHIPFVVLDRPNPLGGERIEGNIPERGVGSAVCAFPIPYCYGMTVGELARMINDRGWAPSGARCDLRVVTMRGYRRSMTWAETGLPWTPTSPHIPNADTPLFYAATGLAGELPAVQIGVGYTLPFELAGGAGVSAVRLAAVLRRNLPGGLAVRPAYWQPFYGSLKGTGCGGVQLYVTAPKTAPLTRVNFEVLAALRAVSPGMSLFGDREQTALFDLECGTPRVREMIMQGRSGAEVWRAWNTAAPAFRAQRARYLLYP